MVKKEIVIDSGHGGKDSGGGINKFFIEKEIVLKISFEQKKHFERNGIKVHMTRTKDEYLDSTTRSTIVKASGADYCISNHINTGGGEGAETIHSIYANPEIATGILDALVAAGAKKRRVFSKKGSAGDYYYMHRLTGSVNTVIIEYGFADNASDTQKIRTDWMKYAEAVAKYYIEHVFKQTYVDEKQEIDEGTNGQTVSSTHKESWEWAKEKGFFNGSNPKEPLTREQAATVLHRVLKYLDRA